MDVIFLQFLSCCWIMNTDLNWVKWGLTLFRGWSTFLWPPGCVIHVLLEVILCVFTQGQLGWIAFFPQWNYWLLLIIWKLHFVFTHFYLLFCLNELNEWIKAFKCNKYAKINKQNRKGGILFHGSVHIDLIYCTTIYSIRFGIKKCQSTMFLFHLFCHLYILLGLPWQIQWHIQKYNFFPATIKRFLFEHRHLDVKHWMVMPLKLDFSCLYLKPVLYGMSRNVPVSTCLNSTKNSS